MYQSGFPINGLQSFEVSLGLLGSKVFVFWHSLYFGPINALLWLSRLWPRSWCQSQFYNGYRQFLKGHRDGMTPPGWVEKDLCEKQACSYVRWYLEAGGYEIISIHQRSHMLYTRCIERHTGQCTSCRRDHENTYQVRKIRPTPVSVNNHFAALWFQWIRSLSVLSCCILFHTYLCMHSLIALTYSTIQQIRTNCCRPGLLKP